MAIIINGVAAQPPADPRVSLLDLLREDLHLTGTKKGCNQGACGACTVLVDGERILSCLALAVQYDGCSVTTIEGLGADGMHPLQTAFIEHDGFQCGYCTPGQICSAVGMAAELKRGLPSNVTDDLTADTVAPQPRRAGGADERQSVPLRRAQRHHRCDHYQLRGDGMTPFAFSRAADMGEALTAGAAGARYLGGGTNLVDLMRETIERPAALVDVTGLSSAIEEREDGGLLIGAAARNTAVAEHRGVRERYPALVARHPGWGVGADPQHGDCRRQSAATDALHLFLRQRWIALQQAGSRSGLRRDRWVQPHPCYPGRLPRSVSPLTRRTCASRSPRSMRRFTWPAPAEVRERCRWSICTFYPAIGPTLKRCWSPAS